MAEMHQIEQVLLQSIQQYKNILEFLKKVNMEIGTASAAELLESNSLLADLQGHATQTDQQLAMRLGNDSVPPETINPLIDARKCLIQEILRLNKSITAKASGVKSHLAFELGKLRKGLTALSGYRQQQNNQGRIVNRSS